jgi:hypothetical protein
MHLELVTVPRNYLDYAYTPVMERHDFKDEFHHDDGDDDRLFQSSRDDDSSGESDQTVVKDDGLSAGDDAIFLSSNESEEDSCMAVVPKDEDYATTSSSWWKWWFPYTNPWWKAHGTKHDDFDMGKTAFAGGSHGEVWRGRRICQQQQQNDDDRNICGDNQSQSPLLILSIVGSRASRNLLRNLDSTATTTATKFLVYRLYGPFLFVKFQGKSLDGNRPRIWNCGLSFKMLDRLYETIFKRELHADGGDIGIVQRLVKKGMDVARKAEWKMKDADGVVILRVAYGCSLQLGIQRRVGDRS